MAEEAAIAVVWGLELAADAARLVGLRREGDAWRAVAFHQTDRAALASLAPYVNGPLAATIPDDGVLYRAITLPPADPAVLGRIVESQLEIMLPTRADRFAVAWSAEGDAGEGTRILMAVVKKESLDRSASAARAVSPDLDAAVPALAALTTACRMLAPSDDAWVLLNVSPRTTAIAVIHRNHVVNAATFDRGSDAADAPAWPAELTDTYAGLCDAITRAAHPTRIVVAGPVGKQAELVASAMAALHLPAQFIIERVKLEVAQGGEPAEALVAAGAAMSLHEPGHVMSFVTRRAAVPRSRFQITRRAKLAALWCLAAIVALYLADRREASWLGASVDRIREVTGPGGVDERLAVAAFLDKQAGTPLIAYEAMVTNLPQPVIPVSWSYARAGEFRFLGRSPDPAQADAYLKKLAETGLFKSIEIKSLRMEQTRNQWELEIVGVLKQGLPLIREVAKPQAGTAPATLPGGRPGNP